MTLLEREKLLLKEVEKLIDKRFSEVKQDGPYRRFITLELARNLRRKCEEEFGR